MIGAGTTRADDELSADSCRQRKGTPVSPRSILTLASFSIAAVTLGVAAIAGTAAGSPHIPTQFGAAPAEPGPVLHLPTTLHLVAQSHGGVQVNSSHVVFDEIITRPGSKKQIGTEALSCSGTNHPADPASCDGGLALLDGALLVQESIDPANRTITGRVLGGSGTYAGATGTITGQGRGGGKASLTISYTLG